MIEHKFITMKYEALIVKASESFFEINSMNIRIHGEIGEIIINCMQVVTYYTGF